MNEEEAIQRLKEEINEYMPFAEKWNEARLDIEALNMAIKALEREEQEPCDFCETIYPDADTKDIVFRKGKYSDFNKYVFITINDEGTYYANIDPGDPYKMGYLCNIKFCPYCGRKLVESKEVADEHTNPS